MVQSGGKRRAEGVELSRRLRSRLPLACELLRLGDLRWGHERCDILSICCRILVTLRSRQVEPHKCADKVFRHAPALGIHEVRDYTVRGRRLGQPQGVTTSKPQRRFAVRLGRRDT